MPVYQAQGRWRFEFDRRLKGARYRFTKLLPAGWSRDQAEKYDRAESSRLYAQATGLEKPSLTLAGAVQLYLDHRCPDLRDGKKVAQDLAKLYDYIATAGLDQAPEVAARYCADRRGELAVGTISKRLSLLKAAVRYAYRRHGYGDKDYTDRMTVPAPDNARQVYARLPELNRLWRAFSDPEARALFMMVFYMGLRWRSELLPRQAGDVRRVDGDAWLVIGMTKNGTPRMVPVHPAIKGCLKLLPFRHGDTWFYDHWTAATKKAGLELRPHDLRHSLASEIVSRGGTLEDVGAALHHQSLSASRRYAHLYPERLRRVLWGIGMVDKPTIKKRVLAKK